MYRDTVTVRAGSILHLDIPCRGKPTPTVTWTRDGSDLVTDAMRVRTTTSDFSTGLTVKNIEKGDGGVYVVTATNKAGSDSATIRVSVLGKC